MDLHNKSLEICVTTLPPKGGSFLIIQNKDIYLEKLFEKE